MSALIIFGIGMACGALLLAALFVGVEIWDFFRSLER